MFRTIRLFFRGPSFRDFLSDPAGATDASLKYSQRWRYFRFIKTKPKIGMWVKESGENRVQFGWCFSREKSLIGLKDIVNRPKTVSEEIKRAFRSWRASL